MTDLRVPDGWTQEQLERQPDHVLITTPLPSRFFVTVDFRLRGFRTGLRTTGKLVGEEWNKLSKKYNGRGWKQELVDDAVTYLQKIVEESAALILRYRR